MLFTDYIRQLPVTSKFTVTAVNKTRIFLSCNLKYMLIKTKLFRKGLEEDRNSLLVPQSSFWRDMFREILLLAYRSVFNFQDLT